MPDREKGSKNMANTNHILETSKETYIENVLSVEYAQKESVANNFLKRIGDINDNLLNTILNMSQSELFYKNQRVVSETLEAYFQGNITKAYETLTEWWKEVFGNAPIYTLQKGEVWYKIRDKEGRKSVKTFKDNEMFHIPFDKLGLVAPYRFSISGHPCLYLGRRLYTCWEEMDRPALHTFDAVGLQCQQDIKLVDLRLWQKENEGDKNKYLDFFPISMACAFRAVCREDKFIPEYIFPQMLLSVIMSSNAKDKNSPIGIIYSSTRFDTEDGIYTDKVENADCIAIPTLTYEQEKKFCKELIKLFKVSKPINWTICQIKDPTPGVRAMTQEKIEEAFSWDEYNESSESQPTNEEEQRKTANLFEIMEESIMEMPYKSVEV